MNNFHIAFPGVKGWAGALSAICLSLWILEGTSTRAGAETPSANAVILELVPDIIVYRPQVRLGDLIKDSEETLDPEILSLDLYEFGENELTTTLPMNLIKLRLALSRDDSEVLLAGAKNIDIRYEPPVKLTDQSVERQLAKVLADRFDVKKDEIQVKLLNPVMSTWRIPQQENSRFTFDFVLSSEFHWGRQAVLLRIKDGEQLLATKQVLVELLRRQPVLRLSRSVQRGTILTEEFVHLDTAFVDHFGPALAISDVTGRKLRRSMPSGSILSSDDLESLRQADLNPVIRTNDSVRLVASKGALTVVIPRAQAMQSGRIGQVIKVKNTQSNRIVTGRVVNASEVAIDLQ